MSNMKIHIPTQRSVSPIITFNKRSSKSVYDWIDRNKLDYTLFNNIIRDNRLSTQEFIEMYNNRSSNEKLPENVFKHFIKIINTNQLINPINIFLGLKVGIYIFPSDPVVPIPTQPLDPRLSIIAAIKVSPADKLF